MIWHGVRHGHDPRVVGWQWPIWQLLGFVHAEMRRNGMKTYKLAKKERIDAEIIIKPLDIDLEWPPPNL